MHVIRLVHPCGPSWSPGPGGRRIGGETVSEGTYHAAATGDLNGSYGGAGLSTAWPFFSNPAIIACPVVLTSHVM